MTARLIKLFDMARQYVSGTPGTGAITLGAAVANHVTFATAGAVDGDLISIGIKDGVNQGTAIATLSSSGTVLTIIDSGLTTTGSQLSLTSAAEVFGTACANDIDNWYILGEFTPSPGYDCMRWTDLRNWETYLAAQDDGGTWVWISEKASRRYTQRLRMVQSKSLASGTSWASTDTFAGDLIIAFAFRDGSTTAPTLGTGFTNIASGGANTCSYRTQYRVATGSNETFSGFTNATSMQFLVFRNYDAGTPIGANNSANGSSTTVTVPSLTKTGADRRSFMVFFFGHRSTDVDAFSTEFSYFARVGFTDDGATDTTNAYWTPRPWAGNFGGDSINVNGTSSGWMASLVEIQGDEEDGWDLPPNGPTQNDFWGGCTWDGEKWTTRAQTGIKALWAGGYSGGSGLFYSQQHQGLVGMADMNDTLVLYTEARAEDNMDNPYCVACSEGNGQIFCPAYMGVRELWVSSESAGANTDDDTMSVIITWSDVEQGETNQEDWVAPAAGT